MVQVRAGAAKSCFENDNPALFLHIDRRATITHGRPRPNTAHSHTSYSVIHLVGLGCARPIYIANPFPLLSLCPFLNATAGEGGRILECRISEPPDKIDALSTADRSAPILEQETVLNNTKIRPSRSTGSDWVFRSSIDLLCTLTRERVVLCM